MPCCGAEPAGAPAILTQRAARGESGRLWRRSSRACRRRLMSGKLSLPSGKVFSQQAERRGIALLAALCCAENPQNSRDLDTNKDYDPRYPTRPKDINLENLEKTTIRVLGALGVQSSASHPGPGS